MAPGPALHRAHRAQGVYVFQFWKELIHLLQVVGVRDIAETEIMLIVLA